MLRLALALAVWMGVGTGVPAMMTARKEAPLFDREAPHFQAAPAPASALAVVAAGAQAVDYVVTEETEVLLDGKPCRYKDVPDNATILRMELGPDNRTVRKIHFRGAPSPAR
jgi:hypothetical protein